MMHKYFTLAWAALLIMLMLTGCGEGDTSTAKKVTSMPAIVDIDEEGHFENILQAVDRTVGKRSQTMQMGAMKSATYMFDGPIETVVQLVEPLVTELGYEPVDKEALGDGFQQGMEHMQNVTNMEINLLGQRMYQHQNGNIFSVMRMDITSEMENTSTHMQMLTVQMMNPRKMTESHSNSKASDQPQTSASPQETKE